MSRAQTGAVLLLLTGYDVEVSSLLSPLRRKNHAYNEGVREIAANYGAVLVDYAGLDAYADPRMWASDRLHMSKAGHKYLAARVLEQLDVPPGTALKHKPVPGARGTVEWARDQYLWMNDWVLPMFGRKLRGTTLGDDLAPRWPTPVRVPPRKGLKKLARKSTRQPSPLPPPPPPAQPPPSPPPQSPPNNSVEV